MVIIEWMNITMSNTRNLNLTEIEAFLNAPQPAEFNAVNKHEAYLWIENLLTCHRYLKLDRHQKGILFRYLKTMTGYSRAQIRRLITKWKKGGRIVKTKSHRTVFPTIYTREDIILLAKTDEAHCILSGPATAKILNREYEIFNKLEYARLSKISVSHIYNLRHSQTYGTITTLFVHTRPVTVSIGQRRAPVPNGKPGYIRVDTVHQGDSLTEGKGLYHINLLDEVTQWEIVICVEGISEQFLHPALEIALMLFPFIIIEFHSDNGSEFINKIVAELLNKLKIQQTKSRPMQTTDNAQIETKNGGVLRKAMGYHYIPKKAARLIDQWYNENFNIYLNYHRPCGYATTITNSKGKQKKIYKASGYMTPYEKLKSLPDAKKYLKPGITFAKLDEIAYVMSDTDYAEMMKKAKEKLFVKIAKTYRQDIENIIVQTEFNK